jgi:hypothetical protein
MKVVQNSEGKDSFRSVGCGRIQPHAQKLSNEGPCILTCTQPNTMVKDSRTVHNTEHYIHGGLGVILRTWLAMVSKVYHISKVKKMAFTEEFTIPGFNVMESGMDVPC